MLPRNTLEVSCIVSAYLKVILVSAWLTYDIKPEAIFGPGIAQRLIGFFSASRPSAQSRIFPELTERESEILALIAQGRTNQEIAGQLVLSLKTVRNHVSNIFSKLQVADRAQAIIRARDAGLG